MPTLFKSTSFSSSLHATVLGKQPLLQGLHLEEHVPDSFRAVFPEVGFLPAVQSWGFSDQQTSYPAWDTCGSEEIVWYLWMQQFETLTFLTNSNNFCQHLPVWRCE